MASSIQKLGGCMIGILVFLPLLECFGREPATINPFGPSGLEREDAVPGCLELSDGRVHWGRLYLTRDGRLKIFDEKKEQHREVPLQVIQRIDCKIHKEWIEKEWRFKENANDEKYFTGHTYPAREYLHTITLRDGRTIHGPLSGTVYLQADSADEAERYVLRKRDKGPLDTELHSLLYVRSIRIGEKAMEAAKKQSTKGKAKAVGK